MTTFAGMVRPWACWAAGHLYASHERQYPGLTPAGWQSRGRAAAVPWGGASGARAASPARGSTETAPQRPPASTACAAGAAALRGDKQVTHQTLGETCCPCARLSFCCVYWGHTVCSTTSSRRYLAACKLARQASLRPRLYIARKDLQRDDGAEMCHEVTDNCACSARCMPS